MNSVYIDTSKENEEEIAAVDNNLQLNELVIEPVLAQFKVYEGTLLMKVHLLRKVFLLQNQTEAGYI